MVPDFGTRRNISMQAVIQARREPAQQTSFLERARMALGGKASLSTLKLQGMIPEDFIERQVRWSDITYSMDDCIDFGFTWQHMVAMAIQPADLRAFQWKHYKKLRVGGKEMLETNISVHDLVALKLTAPQLREMGWTWSQLQEIGATQDNLNMTPQEIRTYFRPTAESIQPSAARSAVFQF